MTIAMLLEIRLAPLSERFRCLDFDLVTRYPTVGKGWL